MTEAAEIPPEAMVALRAGNKIEAIKLLRLKTGQDLKECKEAIDAVEAGDPTLKQAVAERRRESFRPGSLFIAFYRFGSFALFVAFFVVLLTPGLSFRALGVWLDWALKGAP